MWMPICGSMVLNNELKPKKTKTRRRKAVRIPLTGWEVDPQLEEEYGITQWCEWSSNKRKSKATNRKIENGDIDCELFRCSITEKCPSIDCCSLFQRESLHERFRENGQFSGSYGEGSETECNGDNEKEVNIGSVKAKANTPREESKTPKRLCKSASSHSRAITSPVQNGDIADDSVPSPPRSHSALGQTESCTDVQEVIKSKPKVKQMVGDAQSVLRGVSQCVTQKYIHKGDTVTDEGEDENDEGYGSKISSNETETEVGDSNRQYGAVKHENGLVKHDDGRISQNENTFRWIRENDQSRIVKLTYSQKDKSMYGGANDCIASSRSLTGELTVQPVGRGVKGIMAASLSNLSPGTMHFHHLRDPNNVAYLNHVDSPKWGYENTSNSIREQKVSDNTTELKPTAIVLRKVTIQNCNKNDQDCVSLDSRNDDNLRDSMSGRERTKFTLHRTSPQLTVDSTKLPRNVSIPSSRHYSYNNSANKSVVNQFEDLSPGSSVAGDGEEILNHLVVADRSSPGYFPIGELLPAMERSMRQRSSGSFTFSAKENKHPFLDSRSLGVSEDGTFTKQDVEIIHASVMPTHGPPAFRPLYSRSPLQRAREIATRRLHGHLTHQPDGTSTIRVSSPRLGYRHDTRSFLRQNAINRMNSAERLPGKLVKGPSKGNV